MTRKNKLAEMLHSTCGAKHLENCLYVNHRISTEQGNSQSLLQIPTCSSNAGNQRSNLGYFVSDLFGKSSSSHSAVGLCCGKESSQSAPVRLADDEDGESIEWRRQHGQQIAQHLRTAHNRIEHHGPATANNPQSNLLPTYSICITENLQ